jgi:hypothetical protein
MLRRYAILLPRQREAMPLIPPLPFCRLFSYFHADYADYFDAITLPCAMRAAISCRFIALAISRHAACRRFLPRIISCRCRCHAAIAAAYFAVDAMALLLSMRAPMPPIIYDAPCRQLR